ncbi:extracellular solute-binding protein [Roseicitreum antarcticum]|uniref:Peptide/nickel transport system substrate-binding protein n=1 Tax=Roseicitreum antarcticum TaxID=564137 RepID=A0A1H3CIW6_9RHOB|nr:extracellular solute-binding protein [Roseicitreum antarcticum]SDX53534.1 peptide/nickel transport system substrate-binding protein [Roseicitreum antarcticum]
MRAFRSVALGISLTLSLAVASGSGAWAQPTHGIAMYGAPALPPDFVSLPQANPDAPKGGQIVFAEVGGFDSLNPYILRGSAPYGVGLLTVETLLGRNYDEPFALYGVLAESVETNAARDFVEFTLRPEARFSDGSPVTVEDVLWSFETLGTEGQPRYLGAWQKIATAEAAGPRSVRFTFTEADRELPLILGLRPILQKAQFQGRDFAQSSMQPIIGSGPYVVDEVDVGRTISFVKNPDWWGADLNFYRGQHNFDEVRYEFFADSGVAFEQFKAGIVTSWREGNAARWADSYDFPAVQSGDVVQSEIPHQRPSGMTGLVFNTRRAPFDDLRVRDALIHAFNFELINRTVTGGDQPRITSYFSNSVLGMDHGPATGRVSEFLEPFAADLPPGALEGYSVPLSDGSSANRANIRAATRLLQDAGWSVQEGVLRNADGQPFTFTILMRQAATEMGAILDIYVESLRRLGITARVETVDSAQYTERTQVYDFDMTHIVRSLSLSPGNEQMLYWGSDGVEQPGHRNWMGMNSPAAEAMIDRLLTGTAQDDFIAAAKALDRVLTAGRYVIPLWHSPVSRIAHASYLKFPERLPMYGDWLGFQPEVWWSEE